MFSLSLLLWPLLKIVLALCFLIACVLACKTAWELKYMPNGPWGLPLIGYLPFFPPVFTMGRDFVELQKKYPGDMLTVNIGEHRVVILNSYEAIDQATKHPDMAGRPDHRLRRLMQNCGQDSVFMNEGPSWQFLRRIAGKAINLFTSSKTSKMGESSVISAEWAVNKIAESNGEPIETKSMMHQACAATTGSIIFGVETDPDNEFMKKFAELDEECGKVMADGSLIVMFFPTLEFMEKKQEERERKSLQDIIDHIQSWIRTYEPTEGGRIDNIMDAVDKVVQEVPEEEKIRRNTTDFKIKGVVYDLFQASAASMEEAFVWILLTLSRFPDVQKRAQEELDSTCEGKVPSLAEDHPHLSFTRAIIYENWRWNNAWIFEGMQRATTADVWFRGSFLKKGTAYWPNAYAVNFDPTIFEEPELFNPGRFVNPDGSFKAALAYKVQNFGWGARRCIGELFTIQFMVVLLGAILKNFRILPDPYQKGDPLREVAEAGFEYVPGPHKLIFASRNK